MLIVTRSEATPVLTSIVVAPVTRSVTYPTRRAGSLDPARRTELCHALRALADR